VTLNVYGNTTILKALGLCESRNLRHLPLIDKTHRLIGVVTQTDQIKAHVTNYQKSDSLKDQNRKLHRLSIGAPLTGLPNRYAMEIDTKRAAAVTKRQSQPYQITLIDIDFLKR
jgi:PleD family two-component response regulator